MVASASLLLAVGIGTAVPSPGRAVLEAENPAQYTARLIAQASALDTENDPETELQRDLIRSRRRVRRSTPLPNPTPAPNPEPTSVEATPEQTIDPEPRRVPRPGYGGDADMCPPCGVPRLAQQLRRGGKTKAYYIAWSVVDWIFAGQMWLGAGFFGLVSIGAGIEASEHVGHRHSNGVLTAAIWTGLIAGAFTIAGFISASRGSENRRIYHEMLAEERARVASPGAWGVRGQDLNN